MDFRPIKLLAVCVTLAAVASASSGASGGDAAAEAKRLAPAEAKKLKNPIEHTKASVALGRKLYLRECQQCHGTDGRALDNIDFEATDLTVPKKYLNGASDGEIYASIRDGRGDDMPPYAGKATDPQIWHMANFIHSLRKGARPFAEPGTPAVAEKIGGAASEIDPKKMMNPIRYTKASIKLGKRIYLRNCQQCHGTDGQSLDNIDFEATNLTRPDQYLSGTTVGEMFVSIRDGRGDDMPPFKDKVTEQQVWHMVNLIQSIGPKDKRPALEEDK